MDNPNPAQSNHEVIGQIIYNLAEDGDNVDSSVQGLFSRVFVKIDQYQQQLTLSIFQRNYRHNSCYIEDEELDDKDELEESEEEEQEEGEEEEEEEHFTGDDHDEQEDLVREEFDKYWAEKGQDIILKLWIEKYKDFVDPAYATNNSKDSESNDETHCIDNLNKNNTVENTVIANNISARESHETNIINKTKSEGLKETENYFEKENLKFNLDIDAPNELNVNRIQINSETNPEKSSTNICDTDNAITQDNINGEDFSYEWDILWQNHCLEVYNAHFISFKQDWLKNLAATLDAVNSTTGLEYFELVKQEVLTTTQRQLQSKQKQKNIKESSLEKSSQREQNQSTKEQPKLSARKLNSVASILNNLTEVVEKYDQYQHDPPLDAEKNTETVNNKSEMYNQSIEQEKEEDMDSPYKRKVVGDDSSYLNVREKNRQRLDKKREEKELHENDHNENFKNPSEADSKGFNNENISSSEEEVNLEEATGTSPASYNKFIDQPNYLLNKLGLHFGSASPTDEKSKTSDPPTFFKSQKLNLFVSKSKFKTLNHRLKIDTKDARDLTDEDDDEDLEDESEDINKRSEKPVNKHIYFNYSDDEINDEKVDSEKEIVQTNGDTTELDEIVDKGAVRGTRKYDAVRVRINDEDSTEEGPNQVRIEKDSAPNDFAHNNSQGNTSKTTDQNSDMSRNEKPSLFVFEARTSLDNTSEASFETQNDLHSDFKKTGFNFDDISLEGEFPWVNRFSNQSGGKKQNQRRKKDDWSEKTHGLSYEEDLGDNVPEEIVANPYLNKYYMQRYLYWSRYDEGIKMDEESWYSVTPEKVAQHIASRFSESDVVVDAFCGCGGNTIQFAFTCKKVIAIDIDPSKLRLAEHNARVYAVRHKIEFLLGDFYALAPRLRADAVFLSPPWGGPEYARSRFTIGNIFPAMGGGKRLFEVATSISPNVAYYLPRTTDVFELIPLAGEGNTCEVEQNFVGRKFVALTAYYGRLVRRTVKRKKKKKQTGESRTSVPVERKVKRKKKKKQTGESRTSVPVERKVKRKKKKKQTGESRTSVPVERKVKRKKKKKQTGESRTFVPVDLGYCE